MRRIRGHNGLVISASDHVASGLVAGGHAVYVDDVDSAPARRRNTRRSKSDEQPAAPVEQDGEGADNDGPSGDSD